MAETKKTKSERLKPEEVEKKVIELGKQGIPPEKIGLILRDQHGVPKAKLFGKKICKILEENNIESNSEQKNIEKKVEILKKHFEKNKHDYTAQRTIIKYASKIRKLKALA
ncbi:MAG: hypothetical protein Q8P57_00385 [Candidatus Pacearchaeota archaeon]|nr:hypothetical protein [Candidatus Pacearchaeota archaeon]